MLTRDQADIIADAVMANDKDRQRERAQRRETEQRQERMQRRWAMALLALMLLGGAVAWLCGVRWSWGILIGGVCGQLVMLSSNLWRKRANASR
jgi:1,4-dihydroxy-2-naphthoate octaprenyltransferase